jgi:hypothetical protein
MIMPNPDRCTGASIGMLDIKVMAVIKLCYHLVKLIASYLTVRWTIPARR